MALRTLAVGASLLASALAGGTVAGVGSEGAAQSIPPEITSLPPRVDQLERTVAARADTIHDVQHTADSTRELLVCYIQAQAAHRSALGCVQ